MSIAKVTALSHIAKESTNIRRLAEFYKEILGFEEMERAVLDFGDFEVIWLNLHAASFQLHLVEKNPSSNLPESPWSATSPVIDPTRLPRGHHMCFSVSNFDDVVAKLKEKGTEMFESEITIANRKVKQIFFFDPDGNGIEISSEDSKTIVQLV